MAFDLKMLFINGNYSANGFKNFGYGVSADALATITAANYFDPASSLISVKDFIFIQGSDGADLVYVTAVSPHVTVASVTGGGVGKNIFASGTVDTTAGSTSTVVSVPGAESSMAAFATVKENATGSPLYVINVVPAVDQITIITNADPTGGSSISWMLTV